MNEISNYDDIIDSRDVIARIDELESERDALRDAIDDAEDSDEFDNDAERDAAIEYAEAELQIWEGDYVAELKALQALAVEAEGYAPDWRYGETLIRDSYFEEYAQQLAEDIGAIDRDLSWPNNHIDWKAAAEALQQDYTAVDFDGVTYWVR